MELFGLKGIDHFLHFFFWFIFIFKMFLYSNLCSNSAPKPHRPLVHQAMNWNIYIDRERERDAHKGPLYCCRSLIIFTTLALFSLTLFFLFFMFWSILFIIMWNLRHVLWMHHSSWLSGREETYMVDEMAISMTQSKCKSIFQFVSNFSIVFELHYLYIMYQ